MKKLFLLIGCVALLAAACSAPETTTPVVISLPPAQSTPAQATPKSEESAQAQTPQASQGAQASSSPQQLTSGEATVWEGAPEPFTADLNGDGKEETISLESGATEDDYHLIKITDQDGKEYTRQIEPEEALSGAEIWQTAWGDVNTADTYQEVFVTVDYASSDYETFCFRFDGQQILKTSASGTLKGLENGRIVIENFVDILGTWAAVMPYQLTEAFQMEPIEGAFWQIDTQDAAQGEEAYPLKARKDFACEEIQDGMAQKITVSKGTAMRLSATDGETVAYLETQDGRYLKLSISRQTSPWSILIGGVPEDELLEGMMYAG